MKHSIILPFSIAIALSMASPQGTFAQRKSKNNVQHYVVTEMTGKYISVDSTYDTGASKAAVAVLLPYKNKVATQMYSQIGEAAKAMLAGSGKNNPEGLLSNLIADVLRAKGTEVLGGKTCDMALMNIGGIRSTLPKGKITVANIFEILPFENTLTVATMTGAQLKKLMQQIAHVCAGISGATLVADKSTRQVISATVDGQPIDDNKMYSVATLNYLAEGNDGFAAFAEPTVKKIVRDDILVRDVLLEYVKKQTKEGKMIDANLENRFVYR